MKIIFCSFVPVGLEDYVEYMKSRFSDFIYFKWMFHFIDSKKMSSSIQVFNEGRILNEKKLFSLPKVNNKFLYFLTLPVIYLVYFLQAIKNLAGIRSRNKTVVFMGINYFCALCGIILKCMGAVDFVIYRVMDFFPLPKKGAYRTYNRVFYILDKICLRLSDAVWFTTVGHIEGREEYGYFDRGGASFEIIPLGVRQDNFAVTSPKQHSIIYCGNISRYHLLDMLFSAVKKLMVKYPDIKLNIIGSGPDEVYYKDAAAKMGLNGNIHFHGFIKDDKKFSETIAENSIGIALYSDEENFMKYTEPAKVKTYLGYGVPVVVSDVPRIAGEIARNRVGFSIRNNLEELCDTIDRFFSSREIQDEYRKNIAGYVKSFDINELLDKAFSRTFTKLGIAYG